MNAGEDLGRYATLSRMLAERQADLRTRLRSMREALPAEASHVKDEGEQCSDALMLGMDIALLELETETLRGIDVAIARLEAGTYGLCADCGEPISETRLQALPFATACRDCQAVRESTPQQAEKEPS